MACDALAGMRHRDLEHIARSSTKLAVHHGWISFEEVFLEKLGESRQRPHRMTLRIMGRGDLARAGDGVDAPAHLIGDTGLERTELALDQSPEARLGRRTTHMGGAKVRKGHSEIWRLELDPLVIDQRVDEPSVPHDTIIDCAEHGVDARGSNRRMKPSGMREKASNTSVSHGRPRSAPVAPETHHTSSS